MQATKTASITETVTASPDEVKAMLTYSAKNFVGIVDGQNGVKVESVVAEVSADGSASIVIVYEQADEPAEPKAPTVEPDPQTQVPSGLVIPGAAVA